MDENGKHGHNGPNRATGVNNAKIDIEEPKWQNMGQKGKKTCTTHAMLDQKAENGQKGEHVTKGTVGVAPSPGGGGVFSIYFRLRHKIHGKT